MTYCNLISGLLIYLYTVSGLYCHPPHSTPHLSCDPVQGLRYCSKTSSLLWTPTSVTLLSKHNCFPPSPSFTPQGGVLSPPERSVPSHSVNEKRSSHFRNWNLKYKVIHMIPWCQECSPVGSAKSHPGLLQYRYQAIKIWWFLEKTRHLLIPTLRVKCNKLV
jgi:hypothetical protein